MTVVAVNEKVVKIEVRGQVISANKEELENNLGVAFPNDVIKSQEILLDAVGEKGIKIA